MLFFQYAFNSLYSKTMLLYIALFAVSSILAFGIMNIAKMTNKRILKRYCFIASFLITWFFYVFNDTGTDLEAYLNIFDRSKLTVEWITRGGVEIGYRLLNAIIHCFTSNGYVGVGIIKTIQLSLVYISIYMFRDKMNVGYGIIAYMAVFYFSSFNLIRISLAGAMCFLSIALVYKKKNVIAFIIAILSVAIHNSAIVFVMTLVLYYLYARSGSWKVNFRKICICSIPILVGIGPYLIRWLLSTGYFMERYANYLTLESTKGVMQIVFYIPVFIILYNFLHRPVKKDNIITDLSFIFTYVGFVIAMLGYSIGMLTRMAIYFIVPFMISIPYYVQNYKEVKIPFLKVRISSVTFQVLMICYWIIRFVLEMSGQFAAAGLQEFKFWF